MGNNDFLIGTRSGMDPQNHGDEIAWEDPKIAFVTQRCKGKDVLDIGCVQHDARFADNKHWLHKAVCAVSEQTLGIDLHSEGVDQLRERGYNVVCDDAQTFRLDRTFEVIVAGDLIEHLSNFGQFLESCTEHMTPESTLIICTPNPWHWHKVGRAALGPVPVNGEHTCWMCPTTLSQLAVRYGLKVTHTEYGSMRLKDRFLPLPTRLRHDSWYSELQLA